MTIKSFMNDVLMSKDIIQTAIDDNCKRLFNVETNNKVNIKHLFKLLKIYQGQADIRKSEKKIAWGISFLGYALSFFVTPMQTLLSWCGVTEIQDVTLREVLFFYKRVPFSLQIAITLFTFVLRFVFIKFFYALNFSQESKIFGKIKAELNDKLIPYYGRGNTLAPKEEVLKCSL